MIVLFNFCNDLLDSSDDCFFSIPQRLLHLGFMPAVFPFVGPSQPTLISKTVQFIDPVENNSHANTCQYRCAAKHNKRYPISMIFFFFCVGRDLQNEWFSSSKWVQKEPTNGPDMTVQITYQSWFYVER